MIRLDDKYHLEPDQFKGLVLVFREERERIKKDETVETYMFEDRWYHPKLSQSLSRYLMLTQNDSKTLEELLERVTRVENLINKL
jgi:hypothetical protein